MWCKRFRNFTEFSSMLSISGPCQSHDICLIECDGQGQSGYMVLNAFDGCDDNDSSSDSSDEEGQGDVPQNGEH